MHYNLTRLPYCAKALHLHSGSLSVLLTWISVLDLNSAASPRKLRIWTKGMCVMSDKVFLSSLCYMKSLQIQSNRGSKIFSFSCKTWIGGSIFSRCVQFYICNELGNLFSQIEAAGLVPIYFLGLCWELQSWDFFPGPVECHGSESLLMSFITYNPRKDA